VGYHVLYVYESAKYHILLRGGKIDSLSKPQEQSEFHDNAGATPVRIEVKRGDCLWSIARQYLEDAENVQPSNSHIAEEVANIAIQNNFAQKHRNPDCILIGETLTIPRLSTIDSNQKSSHKAITSGTKHTAPRHEKSQDNARIKNESLREQRNEKVDHKRLKQTPETKNSNEQTINGPINADGTINLESLNIETLQRKSPTLQNYWGKWILSDSHKPTLNWRSSLDGMETASYAQAKNSICITLESDQQIEQRLMVSSATDARVIKEKQLQRERIPALVASGIYQYEAALKSDTTDSIRTQDAQALLIQAKVEFELGVHEPTRLANGTKLTDLLVFNDAEHRKVDDKQSLAKIVSAYSSTKP